MKKLLRILGPGLLYAGAAIGVSHLVQSTRAGASYGFYLIWILLFVNIIKYPFFEFATRYAAATHESLIDGYRRIGKWAIIAFALLTVSTMFVIQAAVTIVTAGLFDSIFGLNMNPVILSAIILGSTMIILMIGRYSVLDKLIKVVILILAMSTIIAVTSAFGKGFDPNPENIHSFDWLKNADILFLIAFIGWMPAPIDVSVWSSLWTNAKRISSGYNTTVRDSLLDFKIGYIGTAILAACFLSLGALVMYGSGDDLSSNGTIFSGQLISMYTSSIGEWAYYIIAIAALTTMYSTTLTCIDAYPRVLMPTSKILFPNFIAKFSRSYYVYWFWIIIVTVGAILMLSVFSSSMQIMVDLATTLSFLTAPVLAFMNYKVVTSKHLQDDLKPSKGMRLYAWIGMVFLSGFTVFYIVWRIYSVI